jgi:hypothetical protein
MPETMHPVDPAILGDFRLHHGGGALTDDLQEGMLGRHRLVRHDGNGGDPAQGRQPTDVPDRDRLLGHVDVVRLQLSQKRRRRVVGHRPVGVHA